MINTYQWYVYEGEDMARNKYPEKTVEKILDVSYHLFAQKGYEKTTIQDIVDALGMSKGAIYHHFKSKEDILDALSTRSYTRRNSIQVLDDEHLNGLQQLQKFIMLEFSSPDKLEMDRICADLCKIPKFASTLLQNTLKLSAPLLAQMIEKAVADGSAQVKDPLMCAEAMMILTNVWANPLMHGSCKETFMRRTNTIAKMITALGLPIFDDEMIQVIECYYDQLKTV